MDAMQMGRRLGWKWRRLVDHSDVAPVITPIKEAAGGSVPGIVRYRDSPGRRGFTEDIWMCGKATRLAPEEVATALPRLSEREIERIFPCPVGVEVKPRKKHDHARSSPWRKVEVKVLHRKVPHAPVV